MATSLRVYEHTQPLRSEVQAEAAKGRFQGPWSLDWLFAQSQAAPLFAATAFPILHGDEVRRGDDWRRSGHNDTVWASDSPPYQVAPNIVSSVRCVAKVGALSLAAVHNEVAYRSLPFQEPSACLTIHPRDPTDAAWKHTVLPFRATGPVWRVTCCFFAVVMLLLMLSDFIDDFYLCEPSSTDEQAFMMFSRIHSSLGFKMKEAKSKPPSQQITLLGVQWHLGQHEIRASAGPEGVQKLLAWIQQIQESDSLSPMEPGTGKLCESLRACLRELQELLLNSSLLHSRCRRKPCTPACSMQMRS